MNDADLTPQESAVLMAAERRVTRFGIDLHDGPLQESAALLSDLRLYRDQLRSELATHPNRDILLGRIDDLEHRAKDLEAGIREQARTAGGAGAAEGALAPALRAEATAFAHTTGITPSLTIDGPVDDSTPSQRIALLRGMQESLRNIREHAKATSVKIAVEAPEDGLSATIEDDGVGFEPKVALARARRSGHMGMGGIADRARLLGGRCEIDSRPGGPTVISILLPRWKPGEGPGDAGAERQA